MIVHVAVDDDRDHPAIRRRADDVTTVLGTRIRVRRPDDLSRSEERQHVLLGQSALGELPKGFELNSSERNGTSQNLPSALVGTALGAHALDEGPQRAGSAHGGVRGLAEHVACRGRALL